MNKIIIQTNTVRIYAFIDCQNLNVTIKNQGWTLDFNKLYVYLKEKYKVKKAFIFLGYVKQNENLYRHLREIGYIIILKPTFQIKYHNHSVIKGNVDAELVLHSMIKYKRYDQAIIISGDGDFHCLVEYLEKKNKLKKLLIPDEYKYSKLLKRFRNHISFINRIRNKVELIN